MKLAFLFCCMVFCVSAMADERPPENVFKEWSEKEEWLKLLHMRPSGSGYSSVAQTLPGKPSFFLDPQGSSNPLAELKTTFSLMFEQGKHKAEETQCRFLARRDFFLRVSKQPLQGAFETCEFSHDWLEKLNTNKVSLIFASGYLNSAASSFGHTFLKLQNPKNQDGRELLDYGINFAARTQDTEGALYALYGLTGYFPGTFGMSPYHQMIKEYTNLEGRDLWEYELDLTQEEVERMLWHLLELEGSYFDYYFLDDNCSSEILKLLEVARPGLSLTKADELYVIPLDTIKRTEKIIVKNTYRASLHTQWGYQLSHLNSEQKKQIRSGNGIAEWDSQTLTAGQTYYSLRSYDDFEKYKSINYEISKERAKRGKSEITTAISTPADPLNSHGSAMMRVGAIEREKEWKALWGFRFAFHDELSRPDGLTPFSHLEVGGFEFEKAQLRRYRLLEMLSTQSVSSFGWPISWGASAGGDLMPFSENRIQNFVGGKAGYSFDLGQNFLRWSWLLQAEARQDLKERVQFVPGAESRIWFLWTSRLRTLLKGNYQHYPSLPVSNLSIQQAIDLTSQLELRGEWKSQKWDENSFSEWEIALQYNF